MNYKYDITDLILVLNIYETTTLKKGSEKTYISPPAASVRLSNLEERLGFSIFYRNKEGMIPTIPGKELINHSMKIIKNLENMNSDLQEYGFGIKGKIRIHVNTTAMTEFIPKILCEYLKEFPDVNIDLKENLSVGIVKSLLDGTADVGIVAGNINTEGLQSIKYKEDRMVLITALDHELSSRKRVVFEELVNENFVGLNENTAIQNFLINKSLDLNKRLKTRIQVNGFESVCKMVESGIGVAIVPVSAANRYVKTMCFSIIDLKDSWAKRQLNICIKDIDKLPSFTKRLLDYLII